MISLILTVRSVVLFGWRAVAGLLNILAIFSRRPEPMPIKAILEFLDLLERHTKFAAECRLRHAGLAAKESRRLADSDDLVNGVAPETTHRW